MILDAYLVAKKIEIDNKRRKTEESPKGTESSQSIFGGLLSLGSKQKQNKITVIKEPEQELEESSPKSDTELKLKQISMTDISGSDPRLSSLISSDEDRSSFATNIKLTNTDDDTAAKKSIFKALIPGLQPPSSHNNGK